MEVLTAELRRSSAARTVLLGGMGIDPPYPSDPHDMAALIDVMHDQDGLATWSITTALAAVHG